MDATVYTVEIVEKLSQQAQKVMEDLGYRARFRVADGRDGWPEAAPFAGIIVTAASQSP